VRLNDKKLCCEGIKSFSKTILVKNVQIHFFRHSRVIGNPKRIKTNVGIKKRDWKRIWNVKNAQTLLYCLGRWIPVFTGMMEEAGMTKKADKFFAYTFTL
jgi:hypothetical protein